MRLCTETRSRVLMFCFVMYTVKHGFLIVAWNHRFAIKTRVREHVCSCSGNKTKGSQAMCVKTPNRWKRVDLIRVLTLWPLMRRSLGALKEILPVISQ